MSAKECAIDVYERMRDRCLRKHALAAQKAQRSPNCSILGSARSWLPRGKHFKRVRVGTKQPRVSLHSVCFCSPASCSMSLPSPLPPCSSNQPTNQVRPRSPPGSTGGNRLSLIATPSPTRYRRGAAHNSVRSTPRGAAAALRVRESRPCQANREYAWYTLCVPGGRAMALRPTARH